MFGAPKLLNGQINPAVIGLLGNLVNSLINLRFPAPNWGVFLPGTTTKAFDVSSVSELDIGGESAVSDYPLENGTFTSYNKVVMPNVFAIRLTRDGSETQRAAFLTWLATNKDALTLFDILCPEATYTNATLKSYRVSRSSSSGAAMVLADCIFQEVRQIPAVYSSSNITDPSNRPATPTTRVNSVPNPGLTTFPAAQ